MKKLIARKIMGLFSLILVLLLFGCEKKDPIHDDEITGSYIGTLSTDNPDRPNSSATTEIHVFGNQIQVHCYAEAFDVTILLDVFHDNDDIRVCLTGEDFENMYGHSYGHGNMNSGNMPHDGNEWVRHLNNEHQEGEEHFGYFDMQNHTFHYTFQMNNENFYFQGIRD